MPGKRTSTEVRDEVLDTLLAEGKRAGAGSPTMVWGPNGEGRIGYRQGRSWATISIDAELRCRIEMACPGALRFEYRWSWNGAAPAIVIAALDWLGGARS